MKLLSPVLYLIRPPHPQVSQNLGDFKVCGVFVYLF